MIPSKSALYDSGVTRVAAFCAANGIPTPGITRHNQAWGIGACAYYRADPVGIQINVPACAHPGTGGRAWSWPGYVIDRTPFGVLCHELGHHVDWLRATSPEAREAYSSDFSISMRDVVGEAKLTNYCPNDAEWFAEIFRLYATNPALLEALRPRAFAFLQRAGLRPVEARDWPEVLATAPDRTRAMARRKTDDAARERLL